MDANLSTPRFSVVIPTFNEQQDIGATLDAMVALDYSNKEIIVVDDSADKTPDIIRGYEARGVILIHPGGGGRCEARNKGILRSNGDVLCVINADVRPRPDFLNRLAHHYNSGADYVLVRSRVSNRTSIYARYLASEEDRDFADPDWMEWTEGFSCRRSLALSAGLFPVGFPLPICAGEDGYFATNLSKLTQKKVIDLSITVDHVVPASLRDFWVNRVGRGIGSSQVHRFLCDWSSKRLLTWITLKSLASLLQVLLLVPVCFRAFQLARSSDAGLLDFPAFVCLWVVERLAIELGEYKGLKQMRSAAEVKK
jgi:glycosyltransferase involved in cell wall biosynthesis